LRFWDTSAIVPLLVEEPHTPRMLVLASDPVARALWWGTPVEVRAALCPRERAREITGQLVHESLHAFRAFAQAAREVSTTLGLRNRAERLVRVHPLRAADSLQLAAALMVADSDLSSVEFVCLDERLRQTATREGLRLLPETIEES
jgi:predicted nucleic acid-binding protein